MVGDRRVSSSLTLWAERVPGKDYGAGVKRYAFAAPFTRIEEQKSTASAQGVA